MSSPFKVVIDLVLDGLGLTEVKETCEKRKEEDNVCLKILILPCLFLLGFVNAIDTIVDLITGAMETFGQNSCDEKHVTGLILFIMTIVAFFFRKVMSCFELTEDFTTSDWLNKNVKYIMMEIIVFTLEDAASILFLASRPCPLNTLEMTSLILTIISFIPIGLAMIFGFFLSLFAFISDCCDNEFSDVGLRLSGVALLGVFASYFAFQCYIVAKEIILSPGNDDDVGLDGKWYNVTLIVYWSGALLIPLLTFLFTRGVWKIVKKDADETEETKLKKDQEEDTKLEMMTNSETNQETVDILPGRMVENNQSKESENKSNDVHSASDSEMEC